MLTNAGGLGILCADACEAAGLELPTLRGETRRTRCAAVLPAEASVANPVDMLGSATAATYAEALPVLLDDPHVDAVIVLFVPAVTRHCRRGRGRRRRGRGGRSQREARARGRDEPDGSPGGAARAARRVAAFAYPESAARALGPRRRAGRVAAAAARARCRRSTASTDAGRARSSRGALGARRRRLARAGRDARAAPGLRHPARARTSRRRRRSRGRRCRRARLSRAS